MFTFSFINSKTVRWNVLPPFVSYAELRYNFSYYCKLLAEKSQSNK